MLRWRWRWRLVVFDQTEGGSEEAGLEGLDLDDVC